jgi:hypothetical protein
MNSTLATKVYKEMDVLHGYKVLCFVKYIISKRASIRNMQHFVNDDFGTLGVFHNIKENIICAAGVMLG